MATLLRQQKILFFALRSLRNVYTNASFLLSYFVYGTKETLAKLN